MAASVVINRVFGRIRAHENAYDDYVHTNTSSSGTTRLIPDDAVAYQVWAIGGGGGGASGDGAIFYDYMPLATTQSGRGGAGGGSGYMAQSSRIATSGTAFNLTVYVGAYGTRGAYGGAYQSATWAGSNGGNSRVVHGSTEIVLAQGGQGGASGSTYAYTGNVESGVNPDTGINPGDFLSIPGPNGGNGYAGGGAGGGVITNLTSTGPSRDYGPDMRGRGGTGRSSGGGSTRDGSYGIPAGWLNTVRVPAIGSPNGGGNGGAWGSASVTGPGPLTLADRENLVNVLDGSGNLVSGINTNAVSDQATDYFFPFRDVNSTANVYFMARGGDGGVGGGQVAGSTSGTAANYNGNMTYGTNGGMTGGLGATLPGHMTGQANRGSNALVAGSAGNPFRNATGYGYGGRGGDGGGSSGSGSGGGAVGTRIGYRGFRGEHGGQGVVVVRIYWE